MKISTLLLFLFSLHLAAAPSYAQATRLTLYMENVKIKEVLAQIENLSEFYFLYNGKLVNVDQIVSVDFNNQRISDVLNKLFVNNDIAVKVVDRQIVLLPADMHAGFLVTPAAAQEITVTGTVTDETGLPMPGVNIVVKGSVKGAVTDAKGKYVITVPDKNATLVFSFIGYSQREHTVGDLSVIDLRLEEDSHQMEEVVVVGYGVQKKINLSGAVTQVNAKQMESRSVTSVGQSLQGMVSNLNITNESGQSTSAPSFNVRGFTSISGGGPLILIDNIPSNGDDLARMNPNDIETVSVLKDGASAAIYGARASFGVILITTKSGRSEKAKVSVNTYYTVRNIGRQPAVVRDPYQVVQWRHQMSTPWYNLYTDEEKEYARQVSLGNKPNVRISLKEPDKYDYYGSTDWFDEVYENWSPGYTANFNVSQGRDKFTYYLSGEYYRQDGILKYGNDRYDRYNLRAKGDFKITDWLTLSNNTAFSTIEYDEPIFGGWDFFHEVNRISTLTIPKNADGTWTSAGAFMLGRLQEGGRKMTYNNALNTTFSLAVEPVKGMLVLKADANFVRKNDNRDAWDKPILVYEGPTRTSLVGPSPAYAYKENWLTRYNLYNFTADFHHTFREKHFVQALAGFSQENSYYTEWLARRRDLISIATPQINLATGDMSMSNKITTYALRGAFFRLNYIFDERYIIEANGRYDLSSRFPKSDRGGFFPSVSGAWVISNEPFFEPLTENLFSTLKIRASYGSLGNQDVENYYEYIPFMSAGTSGWIIGNEKPTYISQPGLVSPTLTWEKVRQANIGLDLSMLRNRLGVTFDAYDRQTIGMLTSGQPLPGTLGSSVPKENAANVSTKGWELTLEWKDQFQMLRSSFSYNFRFVIANSKAKITKFENPTKSLSSRYKGMIEGEMWGFRTNGFFKDADDVAANAESHKDIASYIGTRPIEAGDIKFLDLNNDGTISRGKNTLDERGDQVIIGNSSSQYPYSIDMGAQWYGFDVRIYLQGVGKKDYYPGAGNHYFWGMYSQPWANLMESNLDHWTPENPDGYFPRPKAYIAEQNWVDVGAPNNRYLQNAAYCRLKNLTIGYTLPQHLTQKLHIERVRIYFSGDNLAEWTKLTKNLDPEALKSDSKVYPFQRIYSFGLNLNF